MCVYICVFNYSSLSYDDFRQPFSEVFFLGICGFKDAERRCSSRFISTLRSAVQGFLMIIACIKLWGFGAPCLPLVPSRAEILMLLLVLCFWSIGYSNHPRRECVLYWGNSAAWDSEIGACKAYR